jgi:acetolactate synthase-1/2/3 large subunit/5-guanidino-2-oxopentanoate decarboxylase
MLKEIEASMAGAQIAPVAVTARNPDFGKLAGAYGIGYTRPGSLVELQAQVRTALAADGPTLIHMTPAIGD